MRARSFMTPTPSAARPSDGLAYVNPPPAAIAQDVRCPRSVRTNFAATAFLLQKLTVEQIADAGDALDGDADAVAAAAIARGWMSDADARAVLDEMTAHIYVDQRIRGNAALRGWLEDLDQTGLRKTVEMVTAKELTSVAGIDHEPAARDREGNQSNRQDALRLLAVCAENHVNDVHFLLRPDFLEVQVRVHGEMRVLKNWTRGIDAGVALQRAFYELALDKQTYEPASVQHAHISGRSLPLPDLPDVRIVRGPAHPVHKNGGFLIARLLHETIPPAIEGKSRTIRGFQLASPEAPAPGLSFPEMGFTPLQAELMGELVSILRGMALVTGPTGSGKSTTLHNMLAEHARHNPGLRHITIENPVEKTKSWAIQLAVGKDQDSADFVDLALRMDPDVIQIGEIRTAAEAHAVRRAAETGHLTVATLHTNTPYHFVTRFSDLDEVAFAPSKMCDPTLVIGFIGQQLLPVLCECAERLEDADIDMPSRQRDVLKLWGTSGMRVKRGCPACGGLGTVKEIVVAEVVVSNEELMADLVKLGPNEAARRHRMRAGSDRSMLANAMAHVVAGRMDPRDVQMRIGIEPPEKNA